MDVVSCRVYGTFCQFNSNWDSCSMESTNAWNNDLLVQNVCECGSDKYVRPSSDHKFGELLFDFHVVFSKQNDLIMAPPRNMGNEPLVSHELVESLGFRNFFMSLEEFQRCQRETGWTWKHFAQSWPIIPKSLPRHKLPTSHTVVLAVSLSRSNFYKYFLTSFKRVIGILKNSVSFQRWPWMNVSKLSCNYLPKG